MVASFLLSNVILFVDQFGLQRFAFTLAVFSKRFLRHRIPNQFHGSFLTNARHTGNIVDECPSSLLAHCCLGQGFVISSEFCFVKNLYIAIPRLVVNFARLSLQFVTVTGNDVHFHIFRAVFKSTDDIVRL